ncbi:hypothetical protein [Actinopolymorpha pittospori]
MTSGLADDLCGGQDRAPGKLKQGWRQVGYQRFEFAVEVADLRGELAAAVHEVSGKSGHQPLDADQAGGDAGKVLRPPQSAGRELPGRVDLVEVPTQPVDHTGPFGDQVVAVA